MELFPREAFEAARARFEQANGNRIQLTEFDEMMRHKLTQKNPDELAETICDSIRNEKADSDYRTTAYFVLGRKFDATLLPFLNQQLEIEFAVNQDGACYQIMVALDNLDVEIFAADRDGSSAVHERELNRRDTETYLRSLTGTRE